MAYIQSGNVFFGSRQSDAQSLTRKIQKKLEESLGYEVAVFRRTNNGRPPSSQGFLGAAIGKRTTNRFFHSAGKILKAAKEGSSA